MDSQFPATDPVYQVPSPCNQVCKLNPDNICIGCGRSLGEIGDWAGADAMQRVEICRLARARKLAMGDLY